MPREGPRGDPSRRAFIADSAALAVFAALPGPLARASASSDPAELLDLTAVEAVARMVRGEVTVERYASALLERCASLRHLNAFITLDPDRVLEAARACDRQRRAGRAAGPLFGLPVPVKDSVNTRDYPTTAGTPALRHFRPGADAPIVASLRKAGAIVLGKTNLHELSYGWTSNNLSYGAVRNPYDPQRIPGGSSGGTAVAIATRMAPLGIAEDTEGSIRVPAALCGISGFRPTTGRYPTQGCVPISPLFDQVGPLARSVADLALFDSVAANDFRALRPPSLRGVRLGIVRDYWFTHLDPGLEQVTNHTLERLRQAGVVLVEGELSGLQTLIDSATEQIQNHDVRIYLSRYLKQYGAPVGFDELLRQASPDIRAIFRTYVQPGGSDFVPEEVYAAAVGQHLPALRALLQSYFTRSGVAAIVFPATMVPAPLIGAEDTYDIRGRPVPFFTVIGRNIAPGSTAGLPGLVLPAGLTSHGLPVGLELDAPAGTDRELLSLGLALERLLGPIRSPAL